MKRILVAIIALTLLSCQQKNEYTLSGNAQGVADGTQIYLFELDASNTSVAKDTLAIINGKFEGTFPFSEDTKLQFLRVDGLNGNVLYFVENEDLKVQIYPDSIAASYVVGGKQNELYREYLTSIRNFMNKKMALNEAFQKARQEQDGIMTEEIRNENVRLAEEEKQFRRKFVMDNANSIFGLMLATEMHSKNELSGSETDELLATLSPKLMQHPLAIDLKERIQNAKRAEIGGSAPAFSAPTPSGETLALHEVLGKYTIIDFWASWCRPCRIENPNVVKVYEKYHEKGLNIISVSLDKPGQKDRWIQAIKDDNMNWFHVSNLQFWQDPIAEQYNVRSIPATFLLDSEGNIIDKNLRGPALEQRISQLLD